MQLFTLAWTTEVLSEYESVNQPQLQCSETPHWYKEERQSMHWPLFSGYKSSIVFKILVFVFKALHGLEPGYVSELLNPYSTPIPSDLATDHCSPFHTLS